MFGCFILEVLTGKDPWWFLSDGDLYNTRFPPKAGELRHTPYRPDANPLDDAKATDRLVYLVEDPVVIGSLESLMRRCFAMDAAARPPMPAILDELIALRDGEAPTATASISRHYIGVSAPDGVAAIVSEGADTAPVRCHVYPSHASFPCDITCFLSLPMECHMS